MISFLYFISFYVFSLLFYVGLFAIEYLILSAPDDSGINIKKEYLRKLRRAGLRWESPEELAKKFFADKYWMHVVNHKRRDAPSSEIATVLRWYTPQGKAASKAVHDAIEVTSKQFKELAEAAFRANAALPVRQISLDLNEVTFEWEGRTYRVHELQNLVDTGSKTEGFTNLAGIPFEDLKMSRVHVFNGTFYLAQFKNCEFGNSKFTNFAFHKSVFKNCRLSGLECDGSTTLQGADLSTSHLNAMTFNDKNLPYALRVKKISYFQLLRFIFQCWWHGDERYFADKRWTDFVFVDVNALSRVESADFKNYVIWYQRSMAEIRKISMGSIADTLFIVLQALTSKYWSSFRVLFSTIVVLILIFAGLFYLERDGFTADRATAGAAVTFWDLAEFSFKTFTNAGFSELKPTNLPARIAVIVESVFGYISLAVLVFLLSRKMAER